MPCLSGNVQLAVFGGRVSALIMVCDGERLDDQRGIPPLVACTGRHAGHGLETEPPAVSLV